MEDRIAAHIGQRLGIPQLADLLAGELTGSELTSLLLAVYEKRVSGTSPAMLLQQYRINRFVQPSDLDMIGVLEWQLRTLYHWKSCNFQPVELSPVAQWGSCSVVGTTSQKKIVSAVRQTEVVADATNGLALYIADMRKKGLLPAQETARFCTVHRHVRAQEIKGKGFSPHFKIGCLVSAGRDRGDHRWERQALVEQMSALRSLFKEIFEIKEVRFKLLKRDGDERLIGRLAEHLRGEGFEVSREDEPEANGYYKGIQFKMLINVKDREWEIADGGFVDWTQQLLGDRKERLLIAGFGLDFLYRIQHGMV